MSGYVKFLAIYQTDIIENTSFRQIHGDVVVELFTGSKTYDIEMRHSWTVPQGYQGPLLQIGKLTLEPSGKYISFVARTKERSPQLARAICEEVIDRRIAKLSALYSRDLFTRLVYRGWLQEGESSLLEGWIRIASTVSLDEKQIEEMLTASDKFQAIEVELKQRFKLMAKFYSKALAFVPSEEKYILLWTVLEIFPMKSERNARVINDFLGALLNKQPAVVDYILGVGELYKIRCALAHAGKLEMDLKKIPILMDKLEDIVIESLRFAAGMPYGKRLDKYFIGYNAILYEKLGLTDAGYLQAKQTIKEIYDKFLITGRIHYSQIVPSLIKLGYSKADMPILLALMYAKKDYVDMVKKLLEAKDCPEDTRMLVYEINGGK